jgi:hypothetical protein
MLLVIIAALAKLARIDVAKASSAAASIESQTALMGARVAARTIENHLKRIPEALENKAEDRRLPQLRRARTHLRPHDRGPAYFMPRHCTARSIATCQTIPTRSALCRKRATSANRS